MQQIMGHLRRAIDDFGMINKGEKIAVALSGGKDSMLMLEGLKRLSLYHPSNFNLFAMFIDPGFENIDINGDEKTSVVDLVALALAIKAKNGGTDLNFDSSVNADDLAILRNVILGETDVEIK